MCCNTSGNEDHSSATEKAMIKFMIKLKVDIEAIRKKFLPLKFSRFQFTSARKRMSTVVENVENSETGYHKRIHMKGAAEYVLNSCKYYIDADGNK